MLQHMRSLPVSDVTRGAASSFVPMQSSRAASEFAQWPGVITSRVINGCRTTFFVTDCSDEIQRYHARGEFYETEELSIVSEYFPRNGVFLDVGSNVGNHAIFVSKFLHPSLVVVIEPNSVAIDILRINIALNGLESVVDASHLGVGFSDAVATASAHTPMGNLGATKLYVHDVADGPLPLVRGDSILHGRRVDFVKIDVEGMELHALRGLATTIEECRPAMFVEVDDANATEFHGWLRDQHYTAVRTYRRYDVNENYMILPDEIAHASER